MARLGVTYQDVANAANQLVSQERQPTIELIRQFLGTGSSTTIANHLRQWRADQEGALSLPNHENVPQEMIGMIKGLWDRLSVQAGQKASEIEAKTQQEIAELRRELEKYKANNRRWQQLFNQWQQERERLLCDKLMLEQGMATQQTEIAVLNTKQEAQAEQMTEKRLRIEELHRLHQQAQANLEHYRESTREQRLLEQAQFEQQKQEMQQEIKTLKESLLLAKEKTNNGVQENKLLKNSLGKLEADYVKLETKYEKQTEQLTDLRTAKQEHQQTSQNFEKLYKQTQKALELKINEFIEAQSESRVLTQQLNDSKIALKDQQDQIKYLSQEKWQLVHENA